MTDHERSGRKILLVYITLVLLVSVGVIGFYVTVRGTDRLQTQIIRLALSGAMCRFLWVGSVTAKWISIILFAVAGSIAIPDVLRSEPLAMAVLGGMSFLYLSFARLLIWSRPVNSFLDYQRKFRLSSFPL